jgi:Leucine-rich repeat (LRR) protein
MLISSVAHAVPDATFNGKTLFIPNVLYQDISYAVEMRFQPPNNFILTGASLEADFNSPQVNVSNQLSFRLFSIQEVNVSNQLNFRLSRTQSSSSYADIAMNEGGSFTIIESDFFSNPIDYCINNTLGITNPMIKENFSQKIGITHLKCQNLKITDIGILKELTELVELDLSQNLITDISPLAGLIKLKVLNISKNGITNIEPLRNLTSLTTLTIGEANISDITPLSNLTSLIFLDLSLTNPELNDISLRKPF